jgi:hypothetical protein
LVAAFLLTILSSNIALARTPGLDQPSQLVTKWASLYVAGKFDSVKSDVERNLRSSTPDIFSTDIWLQAVKALRLDPMGQLAKLPPSVQIRLKPTILISAMFDDRRYADLIATLPPNRVGAEIGPIALRILFSSALSSEHWEEAFSYALLSAQRYPDLAYGLRQFVRLVIDHPAAWEQIAGEVGQGTLAGTSIGLSLAALERTGAKEVNVRLAAALWVKAHPDDPAGFGMLGISLKNLGWADDALAAFRRATSIYPFDDYSSEIIELLIIQGKLADARAYAQKTAVMHPTSNHGNQHDTLLRLVRAAEDTGENSLALSLLDTATTNWPRDIDFAVQRAKLSLAFAHSDDAIRILKPIFAANPGNYDLATNLIDAYRAAKEPEKVESTIASYQAAGGALDEYLVDVELLSFQESDQDVRAIQLGKEYLQNHPTSFYVTANLSVSLQQAGQRADAEASLVRAFMNGDPCDYYVNKHFHILESDSVVYRENLLSRLEVKFPNCDELWIAHARLLTAVDQLTELYDEQIKLAPHLTWGYSRKAEQIKAQSGMSSALNYLDTSIDKLDTDDMAAISSLLYTKIAIYVQEQSNTSLRDDKYIGFILRDLKKLKDTWTASVNYFYQLYQVSQYSGDQRQAATAIASYLQFAPDDGDSISSMFSGDFGADIPEGRKFKILDRWIDRNPYDGNRLAQGLEYHAQWGGSPLLALYYAKLLEQRAPNQISATRLLRLKAQAFDALGASQKHYSDYYGCGCGIGDSDRYVDWFDKARREAQSNTTYIESNSLDLEALKITVVPPDGIPVTVQYDRSTGQKSLLQVGAAWIRAEYSETGNLVHLWDSADDGIVMLYDTNDLISEIKSGHEKPIMIEYNSNGKPIKITIRGLGSLEVTYGQDGEVERVSSKDGDDIASEVSRTFDSLIEIIDGFSEANFSQIPELPYKDSSLDNKVRAYKNALASAGGNSRKLDSVAEYKLDVANYLALHMADRRDYAIEAEDILFGLVEDLSPNKVSAARYLTAMKAVTALNALEKKLRPTGLPAEQWQRWTNIVEWLRKGPPATLASEWATLWEEITKQGPVLLPPAHWLPKSYIDNDALWHRFGEDEILPAESLSHLRANDVLVRRNHDVVVGTDFGFAVRSRGAWQWYVFDETSNQIVEHPPSLSVKASSRVLAMAEDESGNLWLGTADGLLLVGGPYQGSAKRWHTENFTLNGTMVTAVVPFESGVLVNTDLGLNSYSESGPRSIPAQLAPLNEHHVHFVRAFNPPADVPDPTPQLLVGADNGVFIVDNRANVRRVGSMAVEDAALVWFKEDDADVPHVFGLASSNLIYSFDESTGALPLPGQQDIAVSKIINGMSVVELDDGTQALAVLTDLGISFFKDNHFESKEIRPADQPVAVLRSARQARTSAYLVPDGVYIVEEENTYVDRDGPVLEMQTDLQRQNIYVARGDHIDIIHTTRSAPRPEFFSSVAATRLAIDGKGRIVANDGDRIVRFSLGSSEYEELFDARPTVPDGWDRGHLRSIFVSSDDTVWVASGPSLFRWKEGKTTEFSMFVDSAKFPAMSDMISRVVETRTGRIWVVASDEGHLQYEGRSLDGGLMEWTGKDFRKLQLNTKAPTFITSYTLVEPELAILGTGDGFVRDGPDGLKAFADSGDLSYQQLSNRQRQLYLGTKGAEFPGNIWLFGTSNGVVGYESGIWFFPERLNWLLPDPQLAAYGARAVHAIATDSHNRVYVGTDRGLLIDDSAGENPTEFFIINGVQNLAFSNMEQTKLSHEAQVLLPGLSADSPAGKLYQQYKSLKSDIARLQAILLGPLAIAHSQQLSVPREPEKTPNVSGSDQPSQEEVLQEQLDQREKSYREILAQIEDQSYSLYQMLELKPLDLAALGRRLPDADVVVQYLPTDQALIINTVSSRHTEVRKVSVSAQMLYERAKKASDELARLALRASASSDGKGATTQRIQLFWIPLCSTICIGCIRS